MAAELKEYYFEVRSAEKISAGLLKDLESIHVSGVGAVTLSRIYILEGFLGAAEEELPLIGSRLLADTVVEGYSLEPSSDGDARVTVFFKPGVLDVEGKSIVQALGIMGIKGIVRARTGRKYTFFSGEQGPPLCASAVETAAAGLLYNRIIETAEIEIG